MAKKKNADFQKTKLKVGKKIKKRANDTSTTFKSKRIFLKDQSVISDSKQMVILSRNLNSNKKFKLLCLSKISSGYLDEHFVDGEDINTLSRLIIDPEQQVRRASIKCLKKATTKMINANRDVTPLINILLAYIKCGITHIDDATIDDARELLSFIVDKSIATSHQLMSTFLPRLTSGSTISEKDIELTKKIMRAKKFVQPVKKVEPEIIKWNPEENHFDLSVLTTRVPQSHINLTFKLNAEENIHDTFMEAVEKIDSLSQKEKPNTGLIVKS